MSPPQAERRVRLGLVVGELVRQQPAMPAGATARLTSKSWRQSYEKPADVVRWYQQDRERMAEVEGRRRRKQRDRFRVGNAKVVEKALPLTN